MDQSLEPSSVGRCDAHRVPPGSETEPGVGQVFLARANGLGFSDLQTLSSIFGNGAVDNGAAVEAFPGIEDEKEIREPLQHHRPFTLRTFHRFLLG